MKTNLMIQDLESIITNVESLMQNPALIWLFEHFHKSGKGELSNAQEKPLVKPELHNDKKNESEILLIEDVAKLFLVSESTIRAWLRQTRQGKGDFPLPISEPGNRLRWLRSAIEKYLRRRNKK